MIDTMESKIQEILIASLPEQTAGMMKKFIEEANKLKEANKELENGKKKLEETVNAQKNQLNELSLEVTNCRSLEERLRNKENELNSRELALKGEELKLEKTLLEKEVACAKEVSQGYYKFLSTLVRNPISEEYFYESKYSPGSSTNNRDGSYTNVYAGEVREERRQKIEKTKPDV